ncbi:MAG: hypothetical protein EXR54_00305 [Dehalococcoidia bacterium]|nr:hypothetical protein [Dehalococcoidia bacterium]
MTLLRRITGVLLLAACAVSEEEAQRIVDRSIAQTVTAMPAATPAPADPNPAAPADPGAAIPNGDHGAKPNSSLAPAHGHA